MRAKAKAGYDSPSDMGIDSGRVSKLTIRNRITGRIVAHYERGWDVKPLFMGLVYRALANVT